MIVIFRSKLCVFGEHSLFVKVFKMQKKANDLVSDAEVDTHVEI